MATKEQLDQAANLLKQAELDALRSLATLMENIQTELDKIQQGLPQVETGTSAAKRIIAELSAQTGYRRTSELPAAIMFLDPAEQPAATAEHMLPPPPAAPPIPSS